MQFPDLVYDLTPTVVGVKFDPYCCRLQNVASPTQPQGLSSQTAHRGRRANGKVYEPTKDFGKEVRTAAS